MAVTPDQLLAAAERLLGQGVDEADWRSAASRAYYGAYHRCRLVADSAGLDAMQAAGVHAALVAAFLEPLNPRPIRALGYMLDQSRLSRVDADYKIDVPFSRADAESTVADCKRLLAKAEVIDD